MPLEIEVEGVCLRPNKDDARENLGRRDRPELIREEPGDER